LAETFAGHRIAAVGVFTSALMSTADAVESRWTRYMDTLHHSSVYVRLSEEQCSSHCLSSAPCT